MRGLASWLWGLAMLGSGPAFGASGEGVLPALTLLTCPLGTTVSEYSPSLKNEPQDVTVRGAGELSGCIGLLGAQVSSASNRTETFRPGYSCLDLLAIVPVLARLTWNTGEVSEIAQTQVTVRTEGLSLVFVQMGTVRSGKFEGATVVRTYTFLSTDLEACSSAEGLARLEGTQTLVLTGLL
ncbi:hypothetical protein SAMN05443572_10848 [Myxococcus fulvus]|nr:hypothetical protein SAMN05443572_10848 [Myxococcus fulvus]